MLWIAIPFLAGIGLFNANRYATYCAIIEKAVEKIVDDLREDWQRQCLIAAKINENGPHAYKISQLEMRVEELHSLLKKLQAPSNERSRAASQAVLKELLGVE